MARAFGANQSRIKVFRRCQKQYSFRYDTHHYGGKRGQEMVPKQKKLPLYRGSWMHALQEALHYQWAGFEEFTISFGEGRQALLITAVDWQDVHSALTEQFETLFDEEREELGDLPDECERLFKSYLRFWRDDRDRYEVLEVAERPAIELVFDVSLEKYGIKNPFKGRIDLIVRDHEYDGNWIWDAKWVRTIPDPDQRYISPQAVLYPWAIDKAYGIKIDGFVFNYGRTKPPAIPQVLKKGTLSMRARMDTDRTTYLLAIKECHGAQWKDWLPYYRPKLDDLRGRESMWFDRARVPIDGERMLKGLREYTTSIHNIHERETRPEYIPRSFFYNCRFSCDYYNLCVAEFNGLNIEPLIEADYEFTGERYQEEDLLSG